ncbi:hypothetical protein GCM10023149_39370 [Mucilaginibacter gynuensis]|uniref:Lipoprotein n=1 Tax=Mucilaginibacter gynuensis TaxID=1302236 RepID=A0ABP8H1L0_9SPHI
MLKRTFVILFAPLLFACNQPDKKTETTDTSVANSADTAVATVKENTANQLISPGQGIGHLRVGQPADSAIVLLGRPDSSDAAMGSSLMAWYAKHDRKGYRTAIFAHRNMGGKDENTSYIKKIMVNSPWFKTPEGLSTGAGLEDIKKAYTLKQVSSFTADAKKVIVYDDNAKGITFEVDSVSNKCVAIVVYKPNEGSGTYLDMH